MYLKAHSETVFNIWHLFSVLTCWSKQACQHVDVSALLCYIFCFLLTDSDQLNMFCFLFLFPHQVLLHLQFQVLLLPVTETQLLQHGGANESRSSRCGPSELSGARLWRQTSEPWEKSKTASPRRHMKSYWSAAWKDVQHQRLSQMRWGLGAPSIGEESEPES